MGGRREAEAREEQGPQHPFRDRHGRLLPGIDGLKEAIGWWKALRERLLSAEQELDAEALLREARAALAQHVWPHGTRAVIERLHEDGGQAYLVGGTVRDVLLGRPGDPTLDVATDLEPEAVVRRFTRVEPIGLRHGTVLVFEGDLRVECTTFRTEGTYADARRPDHVTFTRDPLEDLDRRDLTVNAIAWDPVRAVLLDPHAGTLDLARGLLRAVGDPVARFREDALRPLRVARFAAMLEMEVEPATRAALASVQDRARMIAWERVGQEMRRMLGARAPSAGIELLRESGLLALWLPELADCYGVLQNRFHAYDVYEHSLKTCDAAPAGKPRVRWAALLHDLGKPKTREMRNGDATFYQHEVVGAELADRVLERLRHPGEERAAIVHLVREHMFGYREEWSDAALRRWLKRVGIDAVADLFDLRIADYLGNGMKRGFPSDLEAMRIRIERLIADADALEVADLDVDGGDVMRVLGIGPGREVGEVLALLLEEVLEEPAKNRRDTLLERLAERAFERAAPSPPTTGDAAPSP